MVQVKDKNAPLWKSVTNFSRRKPNSVEAIKQQGHWGNIKLRLKDVIEMKDKKGKGGTRWIMVQKIHETMDRRTTVLYPNKNSISVRDSKRNTSVRIKVDDIFGGGAEPVKLEEVKRLSVSDPVVMEEQRKSIMASNGNLL